jgi:hypothetical protein
MSSKFGQVGAGLQTGMRIFFSQRRIFGHRETRQRA